MKTFGLSFLFVVPLAAWAQPPSGQTYTLQAKYRAGEINRYQTALWTETSLPNMGKNVMNLSLTQEQKVEKVLPNGSADVLVTTTNTEGTMNDQPVAMTTDQTPLRMRLDKRGNVTLFGKIPKEAQGLSGMFSGSSQLSSAYLPTKPVKIGESWTATVNMPSAIGTKIPATVKSTFLRTEQIGRYQTARLRSQMTAPLAIMTDGKGQLTQNPAKALVKMTGKITMSYDTNFAIVEGKIVRSAAQGSVNMTGKVLSPAPSGKTSSRTKPAAASAQPIAINVKMQMGNKLIE
jgi:hypothetical protein